MAHRQNSFDLLRLLAAFMVLAGHSSDLLRVPAPALLGRPVHAIGICIFFTISGYLISESLQRDRNPWRFFAKRALRIFPALWVCVALMLVMGAAITTVTIHEYLFSRQTLSFVQNTVLRIRYFLPGVFEHNPYNPAVNGSLWSLPVEFLCYIAFYFFLLAGRWGIAIAAVVQAGAWLAMQNGYDPDVAGTALSAVVPNSIFFLLGSALSYFPKLIKIGIAVPLLLATTLIPPSAMLNWILPPVLAYAIVSSGLCSTRLSALPARFGDLSYGVYLFAFPVQQFLIWSIGPAALAPEYLTLLASPICIGLAFLSWHLVEKRALRLKPRAPVAADAEPVVASRVANPASV